MIINNNVIKIDSNVEPSKALNFGISDVRLVVDILSKLYAYPIRTLVQEYICNGRDAMREAGTWGKLPIEITVPNSLDPVFKVRDFGVGISPDRMANIFVNYGSSTKRNTNTQTGGFGIGAKSAFSYTDSFTVTSFYNGVRYLYVAHLGDEGGVNLISHNNTTQPNGVEISIGVKPKDISEFRNAVQRCVRFWSEPIKFCGSRDVYQLKSTLTLGNMTVYDSQGDNARTIYLIDGIEYDIMEEQGGNYWQRKDNSLHTGNNIVTLNIPNGHFKIASSRERLENNDDNKAKQNKILDNCRNLISNVIIFDINNTRKNLKDRLECKKTYSCFREVDRISVDLGNNFRLSGKTVICPTPVPVRFVRRGRRGSTHNELANSTGIDLTVTVFSSMDNSSNLARKLNHYLDSNKNVVLVNASDINNIPFQDILFTTRMDADTLPMPPKKASQRTQKSTRDAVCWSVSESGTRVQWTIEKLNTHSLPVVFTEEITPEVSAIAKHIDVVIIPKCNKDLVLKKGMTLEQGKKYLLSKNRTAVLGFVNLPIGWEKVNVLKKFKKTTISADLRNYLLSNFPDLKKEFQDMNAEYENLHVEYPLIRVLCGLAHYQHDHAKILIDAINKQSKETV
jgi:hypothetical protein